MVEKILNNTTPYGKIRASHEGSLHSSTLIDKQGTEWWNSFKNTLKYLTIDYSKRLAHDRHKQISKLKTELTELHVNENRKDLLTFQQIKNIS